jgi:DNA-binding transcriptional LysR family regulator
MPGSLEALTALDLNLLTAFRAVDEARHVTRAARLLGITQPALSHALRRLRATFGDPLFVKTPRGMVLTPLAAAIAVPIRDVLDRIEDDVLHRGPFRPDALTRTFRVRSTDYIDCLFAPPLLNALEGAALGVRVSLLPAGIALPKSELEKGACDVAIAGFFGDLPEGFFRQHLLTDKFASAVRHGHPRVDPSGVTVDAFCRERHILVAPGGELTAHVDRALARMKRERTVVMGAGSFMAAAWSAARSNCILTAPTRLLENLADAMGLTIFDPPVALPPIKVAQVWHGRSHRDPAHKWFRELIAETLSGG